jgi:hypothetical protein
VLSIYNSSALKERDISMTQAIRSYIGSFANTSRNNRILFSIPIVNLIRREILEERYVKTGLEIESAQMKIVLTERKVMHRDFLLGMGIQAIVALVSIYIMKFFQSRLVPLSAFATFGINAAISLPFHFYEANHITIKTEKKD